MTVGTYEVILLYMTNAQAKYLVNLCGGLDEAIEAVGLPKQFSGKNAKLAKLEESLDVAAASALIDKLKAAK